MRARFLVGVSLLLAGAAAARAQREIPAEAYVDKVRGMWLGQILGNYAGRASEGDFHVGYPRGNPADDVSWGFVGTTAAWDGDDDTCFEYMYLDLLTGSAEPSNEQIEQAWHQHVPVGSFYVANKQARWLMADGLAPPETGSLHRNIHWYAIDSQITTEGIGAAAPGMRQRAADLAGRFASVTNDGYPVHAAQFYAAMYAAAAFESDVGTLIARGLEVVPTTSRTHEVIRDVVDWYEADGSDGTLDWRGTHERLYGKYVAAPDANGRYRYWIESTVNTGLTVLALLYGQGDFTETVRIGVLGGFDSDCNPATAGGLIGMVRGYSALPADLTGAATDAYRVTKLTGVVSETTIPEIAEAWRAAAERQIVAAGGAVVDTPSGPVFRLPADDPVAQPPERLDPTSPAGLVGQVLAAGGTVSVSASVERHDSRDDRKHLEWIVDGITDVSYNGHLPYWSYDGPNAQPEEGDWYQLSFDRPVTLRSVVFWEGDILWSSINGNPRVDEPLGGYFLDLTVEVLADGAFREVPNLRPDEALDPFEYFQRIELTFDAACGEAVRIRGRAGGSHEFTTIVELEAFGRPTVMGDADEDGDVDFDDYHTARAQFGQDDVGWGEGDFDFDGDVDFRDYLAVKRHFGGACGVASAPVPEPAALLLLAAMGPLGLRRRRR